MRQFFPVSKTEDLFLCIPAYFIPDGRRKNFRGPFALGRAEGGLRFPDGEMVDDLLIYATLPSFHSMLHSLAREWLESGTRRVKEQATVLNTVLLVGILGLMCCVAVAVVSIQQQLSTNIGGM